MAESKSGGKSPQPVIIIKKIKKGGHRAHHGGAWKIAYADFVTAMMAFFLLMWLLSYTDPGTRQGIADYFNRPLKSLLTSGPGSAPTTAPKTPEQKKDEQQKIDKAKLEELKEKLETVTTHNPRLRAYKNQIKIEITSEGLRVTIVDQKNRPMFAVGSAILEDYTKVILDQIGPTLNNVDNPISISGHTDALQYAGGDKGYSNWELSSERANSARRELIAGGMKESKVMQVRGLAGSVPLDQKNLADPINRRISIVVLNNETVERLRQDGTEPPASTASPAPGTTAESSEDKTRDANAGPTAGATSGAGARGEQTSSPPPAGETPKK